MEADNRERAREELVCELVVLRVLAVDMQIGIDLIDASSAALVPDAKIAVGPGFQVPFAARIRAEAGIPTGAVGVITEGEQAEKILQEGKADLIFLARGLLRDPHWALRAAHDLGVTDAAAWPRQYERSKVAAHHKF